MLRGMADQPPFISFTADVDYLGNAPVGAAESCHRDG